MLSFATKTEILKSFSHGDDVRVVASRKQLHAFGAVLEKRLDVKGTGHIGFPSCGAKELVILERTIKADV